MQPKMRRALLAASLLVAEYGAVTVPVDLGAVAQRGGLFTLLANYRDLALTLVLGACFALVLAPVLRGARAEPELPSGGAVRAGVIHALTFAAFASLTLLLFSSPPPFAGLVGSGSLIVWAALAFGNLMTLGRAVVGRVFLSRAYLGRLLMGAALGSLTHWAGTASQGLWDALSGGTFHVALAFLRLMFRSASGDAAQRTLGAGDFHVQVGAACSGYEGLGVALVFFPAFLWLLRSRYRFPRALWLIPGGLLAVWLGNALRVALIVSVGVLGFPSIAVGAFHSKIGWAVLTSICLAIAAISLRVRWLTTDTSEPRARNPALAYLGPELLVLAATLLTGLWSDGHDPLYPVRVIVGGWALLAWFDKVDAKLLPIDLKSLALGAALGAIWVASDRGGSVGSGGGSPPQQPLWLAMRLVGAAIVVPLSEELAFRGYLLRRLASFDFQNVAYRQVGLVPVLISSVAFGLVHPRPLAGTLSGLAFAWLARKGLGSAIVAHAAANLVIGVWVLSSGEWWHW